MSVASKIVKLLRLSRHRRFITTAIRHRVAATTEHEDLIRYCAPGTVLDIGANKGQFSLATRVMAPNAMIHAFEPLPQAADVFERVFFGDPLVSLHRVAIGSRSEISVFHVADREDSSSLLEIGAGQESAFGVAAASAIEVQVEPLGKCLSLIDLSRPVLMKIDVQGFELEVLRGIGDLSQIDLIYVELSFIELYLGQPLFDDVSEFLAGHGFKLRGAFNQVLVDGFGPTQLDALFVSEPWARKSVAPAGGDVEE